MLLECPFEAVEAQALMQGLPLASSGAHNAIGQEHVVHRGADPKLLHLAGWLCMNQPVQMPACSMMLSKLFAMLQVVGLHPDEATEAIVDCALAHGKPFAVVPCCVFPRYPPLPEITLGTHRLHLEQGIALVLHDIGSDAWDWTARTNLLESGQV